MAGFPYETISRLTKIIADNLSYSKELRGNGNVPFENPLLNEIENATVSLIEEGKKLQDKLRPLSPSLEYDKYPQDIKNDITAFYDKVSSLKNSILAFRNDNAGKELSDAEKLIVSDDILGNLEKAEICLMEKFEVPRFQIEIKDDPDSWKRRDDRVKNIQIIRQHPHGIYSYEDLDQQEKDKYISIVNYWTENVKNKGFAASANYLGYLGLWKDLAGGLSSGESAAMDDLLYSIFVPLKTDGSMDFEGTMEMIDGANLNSHKLGVEQAKNIEKVTTEKLGIGPVVGENLSEAQKKKAAGENLSEAEKKVLAESAEYKKKRNENKEMLTGEISTNEVGYNFSKNRNFSGLLNTALNDIPCGLETDYYSSEYQVWSNRCILQGANKEEKKYIKLLHKEDAEFVNLDDATKEKLREKLKSDIYKIPEGPFKEPVKPLFDLNYSLEEKCYELNRITEMLLNTKNAYIGHTNSDDYTQMLESMMKVRKLSEDKLLSGEAFTEDEKAELRDAIMDVSGNTWSYLDSSLKTTYSTTNGEERAKLGIVAYNIVNPLDAGVCLKDYNDTRVRDGLDPLSLKDLRWEYNVGKGLLIKNFIDKGVEKVNAGRPDNMKIDDNLKKMIQKPDALDDFKAMFDVKHHARIVRWNSSLYNQTKAALDDFVSFRDQVRMAMLSGKQPSDDVINGLNENYTKCQDLLKRYIAKSYGTDGEISNAIKKTAAGTARGVGAAGALSLFTGQKVNKMNKVQQTSLKNLFKEEMGRGLMNNSRDKKRKAASRAMDSFKNTAKKL